MLINFNTYQKTGFFMATVGGQAVIEGVMLRRENFYSLAVRKENGEIVSERHRIKDYRKGWMSFLKFPFFRGLYAMYEMMSIGMKTLFKSADIAFEEDSIDNSKKKSTKSKGLSSFEIVITAVSSFLFTIAIFVVLPYLFTNLLGFDEKSMPILFNLIDAIIKLIIFIGYILIISLMPDIKRIFQYHGAEHKVVHCYESGKKLTQKNIKKFSTVHSRCGSSFIMLTIFVSILIFSFVPLIIQIVFPSFFEMNVFLTRSLLAVVRILVLPIIIMISYEVLKLAGKYDKNIFLRVINSPGLLLQKLTTKEPDKKQVEVAIASLNKLLGNI